MTINTRGGGVTHTHTHTHTRQGAAVQPSVNPVPSRPLVGGLFHRPSCVCVCVPSLLGAHRTRASIGWLAVHTPKKACGSLSYTYTYHTHTIHTGRDSTAHKMVCAVLSLACVCVRVCCCCCCCGVRLRWGRNVVGIVSVVVVAAVAAAAAADMIPRLFIHIVVVVW